MTTLSSVPGSRKGKESEFTLFDGFGEEGNDVNDDDDDDGDGKGCKVWED